jgi:hypothetical protein
MSKPTSKVITKTTFEKRQITPTSKVVQISTSAVENCNETQTHMITTALCEDGSIWQCRLGYAGWYCILEETKPTARNIPIPGSWWLKGKEKAQVAGVYMELENQLVVSFCYENGDDQEEYLEIFMKVFEPVEAVDNAK